MIFLNIAIFVVAVSLIFLAFPMRHLATGRWLLVLVSAFCVISFFSLCVFAQGSYEFKILFSRLRFLGFGLLGPSWLLFLSSCYGQWGWLRRRWVTLALFIPGICTITMTLVPGFGDLIVTDFEPILVSGMSVVQFRGGAWFPFHFLWTLFLTIVSLVLVGSFAVRRSTYRSSDQARQILAMIVGVLISVCVDVYCVTTGSELRWVMLSGGTYLVTLVAIAFAALRYRLFALAVADMNSVYLNLPDPVLLLDNHGQLQALNKAASRNFGLNKRGIGERLENLLPQLSLQTADVSFSDLMGKMRFYDLTVRKVGDADYPQGEMLFFREVTAHKETEKHIRESLEFKSKLMALITHDMSGHLQNQVRLTEFLDQVSPEELKDISGALADSTLASRNLAVNLLNWAKTQDQNFTPIRKAFEVNALLAEVIEELESQFKSRDVRIELKPHPTPCVAIGDSQMLGCVARNFLTNALQASETGSQVFIEVVIDGAHFHVVIKDEGFGMESEQVQSLLGAEQGTLGAFARPGGYGIGVTIAKKFIELHAGQLQIQSERGRGTRVTYSIPL